MSFEGVPKGLLGRVPQGSVGWDARGSVGEWAYPGASIFYLGVGAGFSMLSHTCAIGG